MQVNILHILLLFCALLHSTYGFEWYGGNCPTNVTPAENFDAKRFEGFWYGSDIFEENVHCFTWNITNNGDGTWHLEEKRVDKFAIIYIPSTESATLTPLNESYPANFEVDWRSNVLGPYQLIVYQTDYDNYAGIWMCQDLGTFTRQQGLVLGRVPLLKRPFRKAAVGRAQHLGITPWYFIEINQRKCGWAGQDDDPIVYKGPLHTL